MTENKFVLPQFTKIETKEEYQEALYLIENYMDRKTWDKYMDNLVDLVEEYEEKHFPINEEDFKEIRMTKKQNNDENTLTEGTSKKGNRNDPPSGARPKPTKMAKTQGAYVPPAVKADMVPIKTKLEYYEKRLKQAHVVIWHLMQKVDAGDQRQLSEMSVNNVLVPAVELYNALQYVYGPMDETKNWNSFKDIDWTPKE